MKDFCQIYKKCLKFVANLGKIIVAKGFEKLPKMLKIAQSGHTDAEASKATFSISYKMFYNIDHRIENVPVPYFPTVFCVDLSGGV